MTKKNLFFTKFEYGCQNNAEFSADFEYVEENAKNLRTKKVRQLEFVPFYTANSHKFWQITFFKCTVFPFISLDLKSA